jgi:prepilin-type N-terminal cleavage/methylation domain-containing protein
MYFNTGSRRSNIQTNNGFTLIEIVIVLAIAGLIFVIVFLAVQQAQRSRRDTQRKSDAGRVFAEIKTYRGNNNGSIPIGDTQTHNFQNDYLGSNFNDPSTGLAYHLHWTGANTNPPEGWMYYAWARVCNPANNAFQYTANRGEFAIRFPQESGGVGCIDNR